MFTSKIILFLIFLYCCSIATSRRFPSYIHKCRQNDDDSKTCYIQAIYKLKKHFNRGIPEFGFPPMNPLVLPEVKLDSTDTFKATFKNVNIFYLDQLQVKDINMNLPENQFILKLQFPKLRISSNYDIKGRILFLDLNGKGPAGVNFTNLEVKVKLQGKRYHKSSKEFIKFDDIEISDKVETASFIFEGLFKDNPELTKQVNEILNENIDGLLKELQPTIHGAIKQTVLGLVGRVFDRFSVEELFIE